MGFSTYLTEVNTGKSFRLSFPTMTYPVTETISASPTSITTGYASHVDNLSEQCLLTDVAHEPNLSPYPFDGQLTLAEYGDVVNKSAGAIPRIHYGSVLEETSNFIDLQKLVGSGYNNVDLVASNGNHYIIDQNTDNVRITDENGILLHETSPSFFSTYGRAGILYALAEDFSADNIHYYLTYCDGEYFLEQVEQLRVFLPYGLRINASAEYTNDGPLYPVFKYFLAGVEPEEEGDDPFKPDPQPEPTPGGYTPPGGDIIPEPNLPPVSVTDTGFVTLYNPTKAQLNSLASYMWSDAFTFNAFKKIIADPMDCILSLKLLPCPIPNTGITPVTIGNINTGVGLNNCPNQFVSVDFGSVFLSRNTYSYLDWSPYTKVSIYLPFIGERQLDTNEVMGKTISVKYHIDVLTGDGVAFVIINGAVFCQYDCHCAIDIPVSGKNTTGTMIGALSLVGQTGMAVASGGASLVTSMDSSASTVAGMKPQVQHSGNLGSSSGVLSTRYPFLIVSRPKICAPANQNKFTGYPLFQTKRLSNLHGYTKIYECHVDSIPCTEEEKRMIESALKEGVIIP